ncbi:MAG: phosphoribosylanthranilate isomerase [Anaerolineae bacterium]|nr:phosphoribosylanthranilate isomerase [Anaerolineae bacterium]
MTKVKICGIRFFDDGFAAIEAGADFLGFNFYSQSKRYIDPEVCKRVTHLLRAQFPKIQFVGIFVNSETDYIEEVKHYCSLDLVQLHGDESHEFVAKLGAFAYKAFRGIPDQPNDYIQAEEPAFLLDAASTIAYGGTGQQADWSAAAELAAKHHIFLAGGLTPENVAQAIGQVHPWGVDVASGVETLPGMKDVQKMKAFVNAVRQADLASLAPVNSRTQLEIQ